MTVTVIATVSPTATATQTATEIVTETVTPTASPTPSPTPSPTATLAPTAQWQFHSEPPAIAYLYQAYAYTVTFAPIEVTEEAAVDDASVTPPGEEGEAGGKDEAAEEEAESSDTAESSLQPIEADTAEDTAIADEGVDDAPLTGASIAVLDGLMVVEAPLLPPWLTLTATEAGDAQLTGMPLAEDEGEHQIDLIAVDGAGVVITQSFTITVELDPNPFRVEELSFETAEDTLLESVLSAEHIEGAPIFFRVEEEPANGEVTLLDEVSGDFTYMPLPDFYGEDSFTVEISDEFQRVITTPASITVNAVNDPPLILLDDIYTVTIGDVVALPVVVTDVEEDAVAVIVDQLPPDLLFSEGDEGALITGEVMPDAVDGSPYVTVITATDADAADTTHTITWIVELLPKPSADSEEAPAEDGEPAASEESEGGASEGAADGDATEADASESETAVAESVVLLAAQATPMISSDMTTAYVWQAPPPYDGCPIGIDALTPAPLTEVGALFDDGRYDDPSLAPVLRFDTELTAGDYALLVCGCAPLYSNDERASPAVNNQAIFAGVDGVVHLSPTGDAVKLTGFAEFADFTWQPLRVSQESEAPAIITVAEDGMHTVDLWMADDGVLVTAVRVIPAADFDELQSAVGQSCAINP
jgi:hypothetical protein